MIYHFTQIEINGKKCPVQNGIAQPYERVVLVTLGAVPEEERQPQPCFRLEMDRVIVPREMSLGKGFTFSISTLEGRCFTGKAEMLLGVSRHPLGERIKVIEYPIFVVSEHDGIDLG